MSSDVYNNTPGVIILAFYLNLLSNTPITAYTNMYRGNKCGGFPWCTLDNSFIADVNVQASFDLQIKLL